MGGIAGSKTRSKKRPATDAATSALGPDWDCRSSPERLKGEKNPTLGTTVRSRLLLGVGPIISHSGVCPLSRLFLAPARLEDEFARPIPPSLSRTHQNPPPILAHSPTSQTSPSSTTVFCVLLHRLLCTGRHQRFCVEGRLPPQRFLPLHPAGVVQPRLCPWLCPYYSSDATPTPSDQRLLQHQGPGRRPPFKNSFLLGLPPPPTPTPTPTCPTSQHVAGSMYPSTSPS